jgi:hypothetical protein
LKYKIEFPLSSMKIITFSLQVRPGAPDPSPSKGVQTMYVYTVREPFAGFAKGQVLSQAQVDAYAGQGGHVDHHTIRLRQPGPSVLTAAGSVGKPAEPAPANLV